MLHTSEQRHMARVLVTLKQKGVPDNIVYIGTGIGDDLLCTALLRELSKRGSKVSWISTRNPSLFRKNPDVGAAVPIIYDKRFIQFMTQIGARILTPHYCREFHPYGLTQNGRSKHIAVPHDGHIFESLCKQVSIEGEISIRPYLHLTDRERAWGRCDHAQVALVSGGQCPEKSWFVERYQEVVDRASDRYTFIQLGLSTDAPLRGVIDLRGKTSLRQAASVLSNSLAFVGQVGGLMHLARAVDCPAVIIYGATERASQTGYVCNENLEVSLPCMNCWRCNMCDRDVACMRMIKSASVIEALDRQVNKFGTELSVERLTI